MRAYTKQTVKAFLKCCQMARELTSGQGFDWSLYDELHETARENGVDISEDLRSERPYVAVEEKVYHFAYGID